MPLFAWSQTWKPSVPLLLCCWDLECCNVRDLFCLSWRNSLISFQFKAHQYKHRVLPCTPVEVHVPVCVQWKQWNQWKCVCQISWYLKCCHCVCARFSVDTWLLCMIYPNYIMQTCTELLKCCLNVIYYLCSLIGSCACDEVMMQYIESYA